MRHSVWSLPRRMLNLVASLGKTAYLIVGHEEVPRLHCSAVGIPDADMLRTRLSVDGTRAQFVPPYSAVLPAVYDNIRRTAHVGWSLPYSILLLSFARSRYDVPALGIYDMDAPACMPLNPPMVVVDVYSSLHVAGS